METAAAAISNRSRPEAVDLDGIGELPMENRIIGLVGGRERARGYGVERGEESLGFGGQPILFGKPDMVELAVVGLNADAGRGDRRILEIGRPIAILEGAEIIGRSGQPLQGRPGTSEARSPFLAGRGPGG